MSRVLWKTKPPQSECTMVCVGNLQTERALPRQTPQHRTTESSNRGGRADTTVSSNPIGSHQSTSNRRRTHYEQRGRAQPHQTPQHRTTQTINEKLRVDTAICRNSIIVYSGVCTQLPKREHALPCQTHIQQFKRNPPQQRLPNGVRSNSSTKQCVHAIRRGKRRRSRSNQRSIVQLKHEAAREQIQPYSATRLKHATACERN